jgi:RHS repeat-associated protein
MGEGPTSPSADRLDRAGNWLGNYGSLSLVRFGERPLALYEGSQTYFNHVSALGSTSMFTNQTGGPQEDMLFYPWGDVWKSWGTGGYNFAYLPYRDLSTTTDITTARFISPNFGRWFSPDPIGKGAVKLDDPQTWNMYAYVRNNPTSLTDPTGLDDYYVFLPLASDVSPSWAAIQAEAPNYGNTVTIYAGAAATSANYQSAIQTPDANVVFAGHTTEFAGRNGVQAGGVLLGDNQGVGRTDTTINGQPLAATGNVQAASVSLFGCNSTDLAGQYSGTTFTGTQPTTNTTAENAGAATFTDAMVRGKDTTQAGQAAQAAMVKTTNAVNKLPENKDHPFPKPTVCTTVNGVQTCHQ